MANDFSGDVNCVALWKFDNNADDSKGGNDLTSINSPTYDSGDKKEGTHSIDLEHSSVQYCTIADADLDAGFPGKNGTSEQSFSVCVWVKIEQHWTQGIVSKYAENTYSYCLFSDASGNLYFNIGYNNGASFSGIIFDTSLDLGKWYHIGIVYDASTNGMKIRIWDDDAGDFLDSNKTGTADGDMSPDTAPFEIGRYFEADVRAFDGRIDEVPFFNDVLSDDEIDEIRAGTYRTPQTISPSGIATTEAFGGHQLNLKTEPSGIASLEAFGTSIATGPVNPTGISSLEDFGISQLNQKIIAQAIASLEAFGAVEVLYMIRPSGITSSEAFGTSILAGPITVTGITSLEAFGTAQLNFTIYPSGIVSLEAFGAAQLNLEIEPIGITSEEAFGTPQVNFILFPSGISSLETFGVAIVAGPITVSGIASEEAFGTPTLNLYIIPVGIETEEAVGIPAISFIIIAPLGLPYIVEVHDSAGNLEHILNRVEGISLVEAVNEAPRLEFAVPGDEDKTDGLTRSHELWLRDYETGTLIKKFLFHLEREGR